MEDDEITKLGSYEWMESRIPALDALVGFIPDKIPRNPSIQKTLDAVRGGSRWYPVEGGHRVVIRDFQELTYDSEFFKIEKGMWGTTNTAIHAEITFRL
jgi:hypothetical protein